MSNIDRLSVSVRADHVLIVEDVMRNLNLCKSEAIRHIITHYGKIELPADVIAVLTAWLTSNRKRIEEGKAEAGKAASIESFLSNYGVTI